MKTIQLTTRGGIAALAIGIISLATPAQAQLITSSANLPPDGVYLSTDIHQIYAGAALTFLLSQPNHAPIAAEVGRQSPNGVDEIETFGSNLDAMLKVTVTGNPAAVVYDGPVHGSGPVQTLVHNKVGNVTGTFQTEMLQLNLQGTVSGLGAFMIRESPTLQSTGLTSITAIGGGMFKIDSFFDVFTELSTDGGATWMAGSNTAGGPPAPGHVTLVPEPTSMSLLAAGFVGMMGFIRRRR